jgi:hypothetical protein
MREPPRLGAVAQRRSATNNAFAISNAQIAGARARAPAEIKSKTPAVNAVASSSKHHATVTESSSTNRLAATFINHSLIGPLFTPFRTSRMPRTGTRDRSPPNGVTGSRRILRAWIGATFCLHSLDEFWRLTLLWPSDVHRSMCQVSDRDALIAATHS